MHRLHLLVVCHWVFQLAVKINVQIMASQPLASMLSVGSRNSDIVHPINQVAIVLADDAFLTSKRMDKNVYYPPGPSKELLIQVPSCFIRTNV